MTFHHGYRALVCLDRDGTLMRDTGYVRDPADVELLPGAARAVKELDRLGARLVVVSNQSGVARGLIAPDEARAVHAEFALQMSAASGVHLDAYYCFHGPDDGCECRKPKPGLLLREAMRPGAMVGDKPSDVEAGRAAGFASFLYAGDWGATLAELKAWLAANGVAR